MHLALGVSVTLLFEMKVGLMHKQRGSYCLAIEDEENIKCVFVITQMVECSVTELP